MRKIVISLVTCLTIFVVIAFPVLAAEKPKGSKPKDRGPLTKITLIHYRKGYAKPPWAGGGGNKPKAEKCYSFLSKGAKWKTTIPEGYVINPTASGLDTSFVVSAVTAGADEWDTHSPTEVFGPASVDTTVIYNDAYTDNINSVSFGSYPDDNVIAVTSVWGYFYGAPSTRQIVEWDMLFNTYWPWGDGEDPNTELMDLQNIATHELGHSAGMGHPGDACTEETMYSYSALDEIKKRDLSVGDIAGILELYK